MELELPNKKYDLILADPPWTFKTYSDKGEGRSAKQHYDTMTLQDIKDMPVADIAKDDSILCMWAINSMLPQALDVIKCWGFEYKTVVFTWAKQNKVADTFFIGMGYYSRSGTEMCLLARKGKGLIRFDKDVSQLIVSKRREHSRKPDECKERLERLFGEVERVELFSREEKPGWTSWGLETGKF